ncbi:hypothetical protein LOAG_14092, partial [Loa loa]
MAVIYGFRKMKGMGNLKKMSIDYTFRIVVSRGIAKRHIVYGFRKVENGGNKKITIVNGFREAEDK